MPVVAYDNITLNTFILIIDEVMLNDLSFGKWQKS